MCPPCSAHSNIGKEERKYNFCFKKIYVSIRDRRVTHRKLFDKSGEIQIKFR